MTNHPFVMLALGFLDVAMCRLLLGVNAVFKMEYVDSSGFQLGVISVSKRTFSNVWRLSWLVQLSGRFVTSLWCREAREVVSISRVHRIAPQLRINQMSLIPKLEILVL